jgi:hypothetical protein
VTASSATTRSVAPAPALAAVTSPRTNTPALTGLRGAADRGDCSQPTEGRSAWFAGGWAGVDIFIALSGFRVTRLLLDQGLGRSPTRTYLLFLQRRLARLLSALLILLPVVAIVGAVHPAWADTTNVGAVPVAHGAALDTARTKCRAGACRAGACRAGACRAGACRAGQPPQRGRRRAEAGPGPPVVRRPRMAVLPGRPVLALTLRRRELPLVTVALITASVTATALLVRARPEWPWRASPPAPRSRRCVPVPW